MLLPILMKRISVYFTSLLFLAFMHEKPLSAQDTIDMPLKIRIGLEASGPAIWFAEKQTLNSEAYVAVDLNERRSVLFGAGYLDYKYSQYNYDFRNNGFFVRTGMDFNLLKPEKSRGIYWAGIGLHYGIARFTSSIPVFQKENYWGTVTSSIGKNTNWGHYLEATPGVRGEIFKNFSLGWTISMRMLLYSGTSKDLRSIYFPGFGNGGKRFSSGISYFLVWNIPYKRIRVITKPPEPEEPEEDLTKPLNQGEPLNR